MSLLLLLLRLLLVRRSSWLVLHLLVLHLLVLRLLLIRCSSLLVRCSSVLVLHVLVLRLLLVRGSSLAGGGGNLDRGWRKACCCGGGDGVTPDAAGQVAAVIGRGSSITRVTPEHRRCGLLRRDGTAVHGCGGRRGRALPLSFAGGRVAVVRDVPRGIHLQSQVRRSKYSRSRRPRKDDGGKQGRKRTVCELCNSSR